jgi:hypothetical protein
MIKLGMKVKDSISGFIGVAVARTEYLHSTPVVCVAQIPLDSSVVVGKPGEMAWLEEARLELSPELDSPDAK